MKGFRVLIVDDEPLMRLSMVDALEGIGCEVTAAATGTEGLHVLATRPFDLVITDLRLPGADGLTVLKTSKERSPTTEVIVITAHGSVDTAVGAMKLGAYDYVTKPFQMDELLLVVERAGKILGLRRENLDLKETLEERFSFGGILGRNNYMRALLEKIKLVAATDSTVLIIGESGTGKELVANALHQNSPRRDQPLIKVSCAALPETLLEAELFGHEKGAFTGALRQRRGRFELAHRGTLFLDEIGEISPVVQVKLLRVLQERQFERVGGNETIESDVRVVCATQKDLRKEVAHGRFREDLYYRLNVVQIIVPPLRERREDALLIAEHVLQTRSTKLCKSLKGFAQPSRELLLKYSFPGNVRELENMVERAVALGREGESVQPWDLCGFQSCPYLGGAPQESCGFCSEGLAIGTKRPAEGVTSTLAAAREQFERDFILEVLKKVDGSRTNAAHLLGLSRKALWEKCKRYGIASAREEADDDDGS
ncbi:MAG: sigma-54-dependent Fis family transcriptional regulator [Nitrospiraceae bacterium]|nr:sigma-54-dependent Fis family transcriptional regulator [Nitrospiraceae bacterium]